MARQLPQPSFDGAVDVLAGQLVLAKLPQIPGPIKFQWT